jgi:catechol 2,3-dioxygenase-like lactoylglutathione lyase family enzyme
MDKSRQIFLIDNLSLLQHFFSLYDPERDPVVIAADLPPNRAFFVDFLGLPRVVLLPDRGLWPPPLQLPPPAVWRHWLAEMLNFMPAMHQLVRELSTGPTAVYWWHFMGQLPLYTLLSRFRAAGVPTCFVDSIILGGNSTWTHWTAGNLGGAHPAYGEFLETASRVAGMTLAITKVRGRDQDQDYLTAIGPDHGDYGPGINLALKSWPEVVPAFRDRVVRLLPPRTPGRSRRALLVDDMMTDAEGFHMATTHPRIHAFFRQYLSDGNELCIKPHYHSDDHVSITDPDILAQVHRLPRYVPVELFLEHFDDIFFYSSTGAASSVPGRRVCLIELIDFSNPVMEGVCRNVIRNFYPEGCGVVFARRGPDGSAAER